MSSVRTPATLAAIDNISDTVAYYSLGGTGISYIMPFYETPMGVGGLGAHNTTDFIGILQYLRKSPMSALEKIQRGLEPSQVSVLATRWHSAVHKNPNYQRRTGAKTTGRVCDQLRPFSSPSRREPIR